MRTVKLLLAGAASLAAVAAVPLFACGDHAKAATNTAGAVSVGNTEGCLVMAGTEGCSTAMPVANQMVEGGCPMKAMNVAMDEASCQVTKAKMIAEKAGCDTTACPASACETGAKGMEVKADAEDVIWAFVDAEGKVVQPNEVTMTAINTLMAQMGSENRLMLKPVNVRSDDAKTFVNVKNTERVAAAPAIGGGLIAAVDENGNLTAPTAEQMQQAGAATRRGEAEIVPVDASDLSKGYKVIPPMTFSIGTMNSDGSVATSCAAACASKHLQTAQAPETAKEQVTE